MRLWLSGAGGFIGHHLLEHALTETGWRIDCTDSFRHKGVTDRITQVLDPHPEWRERVHVTTHDLAAPFTPRTGGKFAGCDYMIAMASDSHVDRSIDNPVPFISNNVQVILNTLELARQVKPQAVIVVSTDEVYGPLDGEAGHAEWSPILPSNPYAASKAAQEAIAISYWRTYGVPVIIVNCMNLIGERQDPEKYLPTLIRKISKGKTVTVHGSPDNIGTRHYLHARNLADAILYILQHLAPAMFPVHGGTASRPDRYNIVGPDRVSNLELAQQVAHITGRPLEYVLEDFHTTRPGHDPHYGLDPAKLTAAGWKPPVPFTESLERTVKWTLRHPEWI